MKKTRRVLLFVLGLSFTFMLCINLFNKQVKLVADNSENVEEVTSSSEYENYVKTKTEEHNKKYPGKTTTPKLEKPITIYGEDYINKVELEDEYADDGHRVVQSLSVKENNNVYANSSSASGNRETVLLQRGSTVKYQVTVSEPGFYNIYFNYYTYTGYSSSIERSLLINDQLPFSDCSSFTFSRVWQDTKIKKTVNGEEIIYNDVKTEETETSKIITKAWRIDTNGNEVKPQQVEINNSKTGGYFKDSMGYVNEAFEFYFEAGVTTISLVYSKEPVVIDTFELRSVEKKKSYSEYLSALTSEHGTIDLNSNSGCYTRIEAEAGTTKSSPTLYPITDRSSAATTPFSITKTYLNCIGGDNWKVLGDWIAWEFSVPKSGYYYISMRAKQNLVRGMFSTRTVSLAEKNANGEMGEYETLFDELNNLQVSYNNKWKNITIGENDESSDDGYLFYFEKDKTYSLKMEVTLGDYAPLIARLQTAIDELTKIYRRIIAYTTVSPDANRDYELTTKFADLFYGMDETGNYTVSKEGEFYRILAELTEISNTIKSISGGASDKTGVIDSVVVVLQKFVDKPRTITKRLSTYSTNVSSLGSLLNELREAPLTIDYLEIHAADVKLPKANANFFKSVWKSIASFFASFFIDYSSISETDEAGTASTTIEVWMTLGRDQANVIRNLIDTSFSSENGYAITHQGENINVDLKLTGADVLLKATLAGIGPDVALNVDSSLPVNYGLRNAVLDLTVYNDFWDNVYAIPDGSQNYDESYENVYMASSIRQFQFSDSETKDEWFDSTSLESIKNMKEKINGVYALPEKQIFLMMFVRDDIMEELGLSDMIPNTWDDMIDLVAALQAQQLQFYLPVNDSGATALNPVFVSMLYQNGGSLYTSNNMESGFKTEAAMKTFEYWTELYTNYGFPTSASFVNRFRTGEMPIGISYYELYNTLSVFAPELKGKWSFHLIPGTEKTVVKDGVTSTYVDHTATASGTGAVIMKQPAEKDEKIKKAAWTFLKWWTSADVQAQFGREMEGILGSAARHTTANVAALKQLAWPSADLEMLMLQWSTVHEMPQIAGSYITGREIENAYREVINKHYNARETLYEYSQVIDAEIDRKRSEFGLKLLKDSK